MTFANWPLPTPFSLWTFDPLQFGPAEAIFTFLAIALLMVAIPLGIVAGMMWERSHSSPGQTALFPRKVAEGTLRDKAAALQTLVELEQAMASAPSQSEQLDLMLKYALSQVRGDIAILFLLEPAARELRVLSQLGARRPESLANFKLRSGEGAAGWVAEHGQSLSIPQVQTDARWLASETFVVEGVVSCLGVPVQIDGRVIGVLELATRTRREFSREEIDFIAAFGTRVALALRHGQLFDQARRRANEFQALYRMTRDLAAQQDPFALLRAVVEHATALVHARYGHVYLYDQSRGELELASAVSDFPIPLGARVKLGEGMAGRVAQSRQPMIVDDYRTWEHRSPSYEEIPLTGVLQVPMIYRDELVGVLGVNELRTLDRKFSESDVHVLSLFAAQAASAFRNARLLEEIGARASELEAVHRASLVVTSRLDLSSVLDEVLRSALSLSAGASKADIFLWIRERLEFGAALFADGKTDRQFSEPRPNGLTYTVARRGEPVVVPDIQTHPLYADAPKEWKGAIVGLPLKIGDRVVGVMNIAYWQPRVFADAELRVLRLLGDQAAVAIGNAQLHEEVQASETRYRSLVENLSLGIYRSRLDGKGGLLMANPAFLRMFGFAPQVPVEQICAADLNANPEDWKAFSDNLLRQGSVNGAELRLSRRDGSFLFGLVTARVVYQDGEPAYFDCTIQDISARKQAEEQLRRQADEMAAITHVAQEITSVPDLKPVLTSIARNAAELAQSDASGVYAFQPDGVFRIIASHGVTEEFVRGINANGIRPGQGAIGRAAVERRPVQIPDIQAVPDYPFTSLIQTENIRSIMAVPMLRGDEIKGGIVLWRRQLHYFSEQEMTFLQALAQQCVNAIENARLFEETQHRAEQLSILNEMSRALASTLELPEIYRAAWRYITRLFDCPVFGLAFFNPEGASTTTAFMVSEGQELDLALPSLPYDPQSPCGRSKAIAGSRPVIVDDLSRSNDDPVAQANAQSQPHWSALYLPMMVENQVAGVLEMQSRQPNAFRFSDAELLGPMANQIGLAIKNAQLFAQVQRRVHELAVINQISTSVSQPAALDVVLTNALHELTRALDLDRCALATLTGNRDYLKVIAEYNSAPGPSRLGLTVSAVDHPTLQTILRQRRTLNVAGTSSGAATKDIDLFRPRDGRSMLLIPLIVGDDIIGAVELESHVEPRAFTEAEVVLAQTIANQAAAAMERARLFEETRHRADQLTVLNRIANAINRARNLDELLEVVYREITEAVATDAFFIALYESATNEINYRIRIDEGIREPPERRTLSGGLTGETIKSRRPLLIHDWEREKDHFPVPQRVWGTMKWPRAWLSVPMMIDEQVIGVISLQTYYPNAFGKEEERLLMTIADQVAVVIQRARLLEEAQRRALEQETINEITRALNASLSIHTSFPVVAEGLRVLTGCEDARLVLLDETSKTWSIQVLGDAKLALEEPATQPVAETAAAQDILTGRVHLIGDLADATIYPAERELYQAGYRSQISLPLVIGERVIGALRLVSRQAGAFSVRQLPALQQISASVAIAIENARLFEAEQARRAELSALYDLSRRLADATDFDVILNLVAQHAVESLHVTFARIALLEQDDFVVRSAYPIRVLQHDLAVGQRAPASQRPYFYRVLQQQQNEPVIVQRDDSAIDPPEREQLFLGFAQALCLVPLRAGERAFGILMLGEERNPDREPFRPDKLRLAHNIGDQAASALRRAELYIELEHSYLQSVLSLAKAVDVRDTYTADHAQRLAEMALALGRRIGLNAREQEDLRYGALLHDIGKIGVPDAILQKPGPLDEGEWQQMRRHPEIGEQIILPIPRLAGAARIVRHHHERVDGKGYPDGLAGEQIPVGARVLSVVDAYSAMLDQRIYKQPLSPSQVRTELKQASGTQFDAQVLKAFLELIQ